MFICLLTDPINHLLWKLLTWDSGCVQRPAILLQDILPSCRTLAHTSYCWRVIARLSWELGVADWTRLTMPFALLRCQSPRRTPQRHWLQGHLDNYMGLASLSPECDGCVTDQISGYTLEGYYPIRMIYVSKLMLCIWLSASALSCPA